jgi:hypothetical protein
MCTYHFDCVLTQTFSVIITEFIIILLWIISICPNPNLQNHFSKTTLNILSFSACSSKWSCTLHFKTKVSCIYLHSASLRYWFSDITVMDITVRGPWAQHLTNCFHFQLFWFTLLTLLHMHTCGTKCRWENLFYTQVRKFSVSIVSILTGNLKFDPVSSCKLATHLNEILSHFCILNALSECLHLPLVVKYISIPSYTWSK